MHPAIQQITDRISKKSESTRAAFEDRVLRDKHSSVSRTRLSCGNLAHGVASGDQSQQQLLAKTSANNIGLVTAYNDMLSAHQPYGVYPDQIKAFAKVRQASCQVAGGVPAMCDGITQGNAGMELSLLSRDVIAMSTAVSLSHAMFDGVMLLGICDKIVPGLLMGALGFAHLPTIFVPAGPMSTGISNKDKAQARQQFAEGHISKAQMLDVERKAYHSPGTCTFYGTANSNQMLMEIMGLQLPGSSFVQPNDPLREALTEYATETLVNSMTKRSALLGDIVSVNTLVNGIVGLMATGGSTNHLIHLIAIAQQAGISIDWQDMADIAKHVPLLCRIYPNGQADINHFHEAGGMTFLIRELREAKLLHDDVTTVLGDSGLAPFSLLPELKSNKVVYQSEAMQSKDETVLAPAGKPFQQTGGLTLLTGNIGRSVMKTSAVDSTRQTLRAKAKVFHTQAALKAAFEAGELTEDFVAVVPYQGPKACGMPELHQLMTVLGALQDKGLNVALLTDGRLSGASGKVPAAIHMVPEALDGGVIAKIQTGDWIQLNAQSGELKVELDDQTLSDRVLVTPDLSGHSQGSGRELFNRLRPLLSPAESGATLF